MERYEEYKDSGVQWLGEIPGHWSVVPFKTCFCLEKGLSITKADLVEDGIPVISYGQIHSKKNIYTKVLPELQRFIPNFYEESFPQCLLYKEDFVFADTSEDTIGSGNFVRVDNEEKIFAGYHTIIGRNKKREYGHYLSYIFQSSSWRSQIWTKVQGVKLFSISRGILFSTKILLPPLLEQQAIVSFLDAKASQIDTYIAGKEKEIDLLKSTKQRIIADAVTKGITPGVEMKETNIPWLPVIPKHWDTKRAKYLFKKEKREILPGDEVVTCFRDGEVTLRKNRRLTGFTEATDFRNYQHICKGDLVIHQMDAFAGSAGVSDSDGMGTPVLSVCTPKYDWISNYYFAHIVRYMGLNGYIQSLYRGIRERSSDFRFDTFGQQFLPIPPLSEQQSIVAFIKEKTDAIDVAIEKLTNQIELMKKYKQRLISDVVTGQIKVL